MVRLLEQRKESWNQMTTPKAVLVFLGILQGPSNRLSKRFKYVFQCSPSESESFVRTEFSPESAHTNRQCGDDFEVFVLEGS